MMEAGGRSGGTCYGYQVCSPLAFRYLRAGGGPGSGEGDRLEIAVAPPPKPASLELLQEWCPPHAPAQVQLFADEEGYRIRFPDIGWFGVQPKGPRITVPPTGHPLRIEERVWGLPILLCFLARGDLPLHAAAVEIDGRALLLAAPGRFGKTTLAAAFALAGYRVLAEDLVCLRSHPVPAVIPGPTMLRVRRDVSGAFASGASEGRGRSVGREIRGEPGRELERELGRELGRNLGPGDDRVHLLLESRRGGCRPVPLAGVATLHVADSDPRLESVTGAGVVRDLWTMSFNLPTPADRARCFTAVAGLASTTRTWKLTRRLRIEDLRPTVECLVDAVRGVSRVSGVDAVSRADAVIGAGPVRSADAGRSDG
jgi:hypothetical protein